MTILNHQTATLLINQLKNELINQKLWQVQRPTAKALASRMPFCFDTLTFQQWLQFVFIERMEMMIKQQIELPTNIALMPIAEDAFNVLNNNHASLLAIIKKIDVLLAAPNT